MSQLAPIAEPSEFGRYEKQFKTSTCNIVLGTQVRG